MDINFFPDDRGFIQKYALQYNEGLAPRTEPLGLQTDAIIQSTPRHQTQ
ncbi:MAG: hypothetical protein IPF46_16260 [Saprospiraceae bacterium]|nr:hypothetical protein [Candidatus Vicinibacter affinis]